jgi:hypothetical protein
MKFTNFFLHTRLGPNRKDIKMERIEQVFYKPEYEQIQEDGRIRRLTLPKLTNIYGL